MPGSNIKSAPVQLPKVYKTQDFNEEVYRNNRLATMYGTEASRRDRRKFNRYMQSEAGLAEMEQAKQKHTKEENAKALKSYQAYAAASKQQGSDRLAAMRAEWDKARAKYDAISTDEVSKPVAPTLVSKTDWNARAKEYGFNSMDDVKQWQAANGLAVDGKFGNQSIAKWQALQQKSQPELQQRQPTSDITYRMPGSGISVGSTQTQSAVTQSKQPQPKVQQTTVEQPAGYTPKAFTLQDFNNHKNFRDPYHEFKTITVDGKTYPIRVTTGLYGRSDIENDHSYAFDEETGMIRKVGEYLAGTPTGKFAKDSQWIHPSFFYEEQWLKQNPAPAKRSPLGGAITPEYQKWFSEMYEPASKAEFRKQGGIMNRINYFQQGGAAPKQDIKAQITALVQAAMQGDQKATQQVNQIMEAAKAGNQQAVQLAQLITEVAKQLQGQATSAKWGSKLDYIKSLKFAKGGKTCPVCDKKVEMKACGGKKAKKRYFGGII